MKFFYTKICVQCNREYFKKEISEDHFLNASELLDNVYKPPHTAEVIMKSSCGECVTNFNREYSAA